MLDGPHCFKIIGHSQFIFIIINLHSEFFVVYKGNVMTLYKLPAKQMERKILANLDV